MTDALFKDMVFSYDAQCKIDVTSASKVIALVLDCDEICDKNRGIPEFHELLQKSVDL